MTNEQIALLNKAAITLKLLSDAVTTQGNVEQAKEYLNMANAVLDARHQLVALENAKQ